MRDGRARGIYTVVAVARRRRRHTDARAMGKEKTPKKDKREKTPKKDKSASPGGDSEDEGDGALRPTAPIATPLADLKTTKKILKVVKKGARARTRDASERDARRSNGRRERAATEGERARTRGGMGELLRIRDAERRLTRRRTNAKQRPRRSR